jgi:membrane associated rhomboid family serine protease
MQKVAALRQLFAEYGYTPMRKRADAELEELDRRIAEGKQDPDEHAILAKKREAALKRLQRQTGSLRLGDTGYSPSLLNWTLGGALTGGAVAAAHGALRNTDRYRRNGALGLGAAGALSGGIGGLITALLARRKLNAMRENPREDNPSKLRGLGNGILTGGGIGALLGGGAGALLTMGTQNRDKVDPLTGVAVGAAAGGGLGALLGGGLGLRSAAEARILARRAGLMRGGDDTDLAARASDKFFGGLHTLPLSQQPQYS